LYQLSKAQSLWCGMSLKQPSKHPSRNSQLRAQPGLAMLGHWSWGWEHTRIRRGLEQSISSPTRWIIADMSSFMLPVPAQFHIVPVLNYWSMVSPKTLHTTSFTRRHWYTSRMCSVWLYKACPRGYHR
jgi:hypothetical protein